MDGWMDDETLLYLTVEEFSKVVWKTEEPSAGCSDDVVQEQTDAMDG